MSETPAPPLTDPSPLPAPLPAPGEHGRAWRNPWLYVVLIALALAGWQWAETRWRLAATQQELARRLAENDAVAKESRALAHLAQEEIVVLRGKLGEVEARLAESRSQQATLETLYRDLARNRDEWALAEVEQGVTLAAQQLQLAGNVEGAVLALQTADARLAGSGRPQFISLRKVLARDLDRLRALPQVDLAGMNVDLESVISVIDRLPLAVDSRPHDSVSSTPRPASEAGADASWRSLIADFWSELRALIRIQRFDRSEPALLAPQQVFFLRENLKLRLLNARLALLAHDQWVFRNELKQARLWVERYFDPRDKLVQTAQDTLKQLSATEINIELPNLNQSLSAIKTFKAGKDSK